MIQLGSFDANVPEAACKAYEKQVFEITRVPIGVKVDGICGYRTLSAMRLFQEYVRSYEKLSCLPDGRFPSA